MQNVSSPDHGHDVRWIQAVFGIDGGDIVRSDACPSRGTANRYPRKQIGQHVVPSQFGRVTFAQRLGRKPVALPYVAEPEFVHHGWRDGPYIRELNVVGVHVAVVSELLVVSSTLKKKNILFLKMGPPTAPPKLLYFLIGTEGEKSSGRSNRCFAETRRPSRAIGSFHSC